MQIREALPKDVPQIISVLKASLGEADLPLSEEIWKYKHIDNPFGKSLVLIAVEDNKIAGVRAFMRWKWQQGDKVYSTFRAVDTATHPDFQGRGVFKKLTLKAVDLGINENDHFVFNTPNEKSKPGYLKMGWKEVGKLKVGLQPAWNSFFKLNSKIPEYELNLMALSPQLNELCKDWNISLEKQSSIFTPKSPNFLNWRYENNPLQNYEVHSNSEFYFACYVKKRKKIKELRISECIFRNEKSASQIKVIIKKLSIKFGVQMVSFSPDMLFKTDLSLKGNYGPILTVRNLNLKEDELYLEESIENWRYSLGDLELF